MGFDNKGVGVVDKPLDVVDFGRGGLVGCFFTVERRVKGVTIMPLLITYPEQTIVNDL